MMNKDSELVCICVPVYNAEATLAETLDSLLNQTWHSMIIKIVDNASSDKSIDIAQAFAQRDNRIRVIQNENNIGAEGNFNRCIALMEGEYAAIFHSDDIYEKNIVERQVQALCKDASLSAVFTSAFDINADGDIIATRDMPREIIDQYKGRLNYKTALRLVFKYANFFICPSCMARTSSFQSSNGWSGKKYKSSADLALWFELLKTGPVQLLSDRLMNYRVSDSSFSYRLARTRMHRHDLFLVLDDLQVENRGILLKDDIENIFILHIRDKVNRAVSCLINGKKPMAACLLCYVLKFSHQSMLMRSKRGLKYLFMSYATSILSLVPSWSLYRRILYRLRFV